MIKHFLTFVIMNQRLYLIVISRTYIIKHIQLVLSLVTFSRSRFLMSQPRPATIVTLARSCPHPHPVQCYTSDWEPDHNLIICLKWFWISLYWICTSNGEFGCLAFQHTHTNTCQGQSTIISIQSSVLHGRLIFSPTWTVNLLVLHGRLIFSPIWTWKAILHHSQCHWKF